MTIAAANYSHKVKPTVSASNKRHITTVLIIHVTTSNDTDTAQCRGILHLQLSILMQQNYLDCVLEQLLKR